jgi:hypothetical protein
MVHELRSRPRLRTALSWGSLFCQPRLITDAVFEAEITAAESERFERDPTSPPSLVEKGRR